MSRRIRNVPAIRPVLSVGTLTAWLAVAVLVSPIPGASAQQPDRSASRVTTGTIQLLAPAYNSSWSSTTVIHFSWGETWSSGSAGAIERLTIATDPGLTNVVWEGGWTCPASSGAPTCPISTDVGPLAAGITYYWAVAVLVGSDPWHVSTVWPFTVNPPPPVTSINSYPPNPSNSANAAFTFSSNEPGSFECQLDSGSFVACTGPATYVGLADGSHTFKVQATNETGQTDPTPASYTWTVDTRVPETSITAHPVDPTNSTSPSFSFAAGETASFQCSLDGGGFAACTSPATYSGVAEGAHTFSVRATDTAGNTDATPAVYAWTIDTTPPDVSLDSAPDEISTSKTATFVFSTDDAVRFQCRLDGGPSVSCTSPWTYTKLKKRSHLFELSGRDKAGNVGDADPFAWTNGKVPKVSIKHKPPSHSHDSDAVFTFESSDPGATYECSLDGGLPGDCTSPTEYTGLADGQHTFAVEGTDAAGRTGKPASYTWTITT